MDATAGGAAAEAGNGESTACSRENGGSGWESNPPLRGSTRSRTALKAARVTRPESLPLDMMHASVGPGKRNQLP
jgi:hypothetical protein